MICRLVLVVFFSKCIKVAIGLSIKSLVVLLVLQGVDGPFLLTLQLAMVAQPLVLGALILVSSLLGAIA